jgi:tyrosyl-tRNA synthetase
LASSNNEARKLVVEGAVTIGDNKERIVDLHHLVNVIDGLVVRVGKRKVVRVRIL